MFYRRHSRAARARRTNTTRQFSGYRRRLALEALEERRLLATYTWDNTGNSLAIHLETNESLTVSETGGNVSFALSNGDGTLVFNQIDGSTATAVTLTTQANVALDGSNNLVITDFDPAGVDNRMELSVDGANLVVKDPNQVLTTTIADATGSGTHELRIPLAAIVGNKVIVNSLEGDDNLTVKSSVTAAGLAVDYDGGSGNNALAAVGTGTETAIYTPNATTPGDGAIALGGKNISFVNLTPVDISGMANAEVNLPGANDILTVAEGVDFMSGGTHAALRVTGTSGGVAIEAAAFWDNGTLIIDTTGVDGVDSITLDSAGNAHLNTNLRINTGDGLDHVIVDGAIAFAGDIEIVSSIITLKTGSLTAGDRVTIDTTDDQLIVEGAFGSIVAAEALLKVKTLVGPQTFLNTKVDRLDITKLSNSGALGVRNDGALQLIDLNADGFAVQAASVLGITAASPLTISSDVNVHASTSFSAEDSAAAGDDLTIEDGVDINANGNNLQFIAGDNFLFAVGASIVNGANVTVNVDPSSVALPDNDAGTGSSVSFFGTITATQLTINGGADADQFLINASVNTPIQVNGGNPTTTPGDRLIVPLGGITDANLAGATLPNGSITFTAGSHKTITYTSIEGLLANTLIVDTLDDEDDGDYSVGDLSLREAIGIANSIPGADTITFAAALTSGGPKTIQLTMDEIEITEALTIDGPGADLLTVGGNSRIFNITATTGDFTIDGLTLTGGSTTGDNADNTDTTYSGGAIRSLTDGTLSITDCVVTGNFTTGLRADGGAIFAVGNVAISGSTIEENRTEGNFSDGGAVFTRADLAITESTVSGNHTKGNRADGGGVYAGGNVSVTKYGYITANHTEGSRADGGGIFAVGNVTITEFSSISGNHTEGSRADGGGVYAGGNVSVTKYSDVSENHTVGSYADGGGIYAVGDVTLSSSTVNGNHTEGDNSYGGGIFAGDNVTLTNDLGATKYSEVSENYTKGDNAIGGGIYADGNVTLTGSTVTGNHTEGQSSHGGGIYSGSVTFSRSTVSDNYTEDSSSQGGGLFVRSASDASSITNSTISGNTAAGSGGGIYADTELDVALTITNTTISGNTASGEGGGIFNFDGLTVIEFATITNNSAPAAQGSGVASYGDNLTRTEVYSSIIAGNTNTDIDFVINVTNSFQSNGYNLIGDGNAVGEFTEPGDQTAVADPGLFDLGDYGGPTQTHLLKPTSPALDAGNPLDFQGLGGVPEFDQRGTGFPRVLDGNGDLVPRIDIGAIEVENQFNGPQVIDVFITDHPEYDLFVPKPTDGPTPLVKSISVRVRDLPPRLAALPIPALNEALAEIKALYTVVGDANGIIPIAQVIVTNDEIVEGQPATATIEIIFAKPLPDDRFTLTISDAVRDPEGNRLDGESDAIQPISPTFPSGDGAAGGNFVARFTIDSRPEIGVWSGGQVLIDTNGNFIFDPTNLDFVNRDLAYALGFASDYVFAGNFVLDKLATADGFDKLAAYGRVGNQFRWIIDFNNDGIPDQIFNEASINGLPVAGDFGNPSGGGEIEIIIDNGDEVGLFTGTEWHLDTDHDFKVDKVVPALDYGGFPIVGDFNGDGFDDLATYRPTSGQNIFSIALYDPVAGDWPTSATHTFRVGLPGDFFGFGGVLERPVAADMNRDGVDDLGLWVPGLFGQPASWYFLLSNNDTATEPVENSIIDRVEAAEAVTLPGQIPFVSFNITPFGQDLFAQFGHSSFQPVVGNFDPPTAFNPVTVLTTPTINPNANSAVVNRPQSTTTTPRTTTPRPTTTTPPTTSTQSSSTAKLATKNATKASSGATAVPSKTVAAATPVETPSKEATPVVNAPAATPKVGTSAVVNSPVVGAAGATGKGKESSTPIDSQPVANPPASTGTPKSISEQPAAVIVTTVVATTQSPPVVLDKKNPAPPALPENDAKEVAPTKSVATTTLKPAKTSVTAPPVVVALMKQSKEAVEAPSSAAALTITLPTNSLPVPDLETPAKAPAAKPAAAVVAKETIHESSSATKAVHTQTPAVAVVVKETVRESSPAIAKKEVQVSAAAATSATTLQTVVAAAPANLAAGSASSSAPGTAIASPTAASIPKTESVIVAASLTECPPELPKVVEQLPVGEIVAAAVTVDTSARKSTHCPPIIEVLVTQTAVSVLPTVASISAAAANAVAAPAAASTSIVSTTALKQSGVQEQIATPVITPPLSPPAKLAIKQPIATSAASLTKPVFAEDISKVIPARVVDSAMKPVAASRSATMEATVMAPLKKEAFLATDRVVEPAVTTATTLGDYSIPTSVNVRTSGASAMAAMPTAPMTRVAALDAAIASVRATRDMEIAADLSRVALSDSRSDNHADNSQAQNKPGKMPLAFELAWADLD